MAPDLEPRKTDFGRTGTALLLVSLLLASCQPGSPPANQEPGPETNSDLRAPVANPVLEPDRPDLIGEPRIDEP